MSFIFSVAIIGIAIAILVIRAQYKTEQKKSKRTALLALSIVQSVLALFEALSSIITIPLYLFVIGFITHDTDLPDSPLPGVSFNGIFTFLILIKLAVVAMCLISLILGYSAVTNKQWTNNAMENYRTVNPQLFKTCAVCGLVVGQGQYRCNRCGSMQFYRYNPYPAQYAQIPPPPPAERRCECGEIIGAFDHFCSNCGKKV